MKKSKSFIFLTTMILVMTWAVIAGAGEIVIGYSGPLSGPGAEYGEDCFNGLDMAVREINASGGISVKGENYTFRLEKKDDRGYDATAAINNARQFRKEQKAIAIFNPVATTILPLMKINEEKRNEFIIMGYTSIPQVSEMGNKLLITLAVPLTLYAKIEADLAWANGWRKVAMLVTGGPYGDIWRKTFGEEWVKRGGLITTNKAANYYTRTDFNAPLAEALDTNPDFLFIGGPSSTTALIIDQARAKGFEGGFVMIDQAKLEAIYSLMRKPLLMEGSIGLARIKDVPLPVGPTFRQNYASSYKRPINYESVTHYTGMHTLARAIVAAGTVDNVRAIRAAFSTIFPMLGDKYPMEIFGISSSGRLIYPCVVQSIKYGRFTEAKVYYWWPKTQKEFGQYQKLTKGTSPLIWQPMAK